MPGFLIGNQNNPQSVPLPSEVARSHRWTITILGTDKLTAEQKKAIGFYAISVTRPSIEIDRITIHNRSNEMYLPGKYRAPTIDMAVYEIITEQGIISTTDAVRKWWDGVVYNTKIHSMNLQTCKVDMEAVMEDGCGEVARRYVISGVFPIRVAPSSLEYTSTDLSTVTVTLSIDGFYEE